MSVSQMFPIPKDLVNQSQRTMLIGAQNTCKTSLLFQCLKTVAAEQKKTVLFIAPQKVMKLPRNVHKMISFDTSTCDKLLNIYLETADELLEFLSQVHTYDMNACCIAVDDFNIFMKRRKTTEVSYLEYASRILALLMDTAVQCGNLSVCVSTDIEEEHEHEKNLLTRLAEYYFNQVWCINIVPSLGLRSDFIMHCDKKCISIHYYVEDDQIFLSDVKEVTQEILQI